MNPERRWPGAVLHVALAFAAFTAVAAGIRTFVPWPAEYGLRAKVEYFRAHRDRFDTIYIGSSYTHRAYRPSVIDADLLQLGIRQTSFNFGINGMGFYEVNNVLDELLDGPSGRPRTVCVEAMSANPRPVVMRTAFENRAVFWHSLSQTAQVLRAVWALPDPLADRLAMALTHVNMAGRKFTNYGQGARILLALRGQDGLHDYLQPADLEEGQGYQDPESGHDEGEVEDRQRFLSHVPDFLKLVADVDAGNARKAPYRQAEAALVARQFGWLVERGYRTLSVVPPVVAPSAEVYRMHEDGVIPALIGFNSPAKYPQLYVVEAHYDRGHLSRVGAEAFSHAFAPEFARFLAAPGGDPPPAPPGP